MKDKLQIPFTMTLEDIGRFAHVLDAVLKNDPKGQGVTNNKEIDPEAIVKVLNVDTREAVDLLEQMTVLSGVFHNYMVHCDKDSESPESTPLNPNGPLYGTYLLLGHLKDSKIQSNSR